MGRKHKLQPRVASVHTHFNLFRDIHQANDGPVTKEEEIKAIERFIHWHERQVHVGKYLLGLILQDKVNEGLNIYIPSQAGALAPLDAVREVQPKELVEKG